MAIALLIASLITSFCFISLPAAAVPNVSNTPNISGVSGAKKTKFDQLYRSAELEMGHLNIEKARKLYKEIVTLSGPASSDKAGNGTKARIVLKSYLPLYTVTPACNDMYKQGDVLMRSQNPHEALSIFTDLANRYPKFEWAQTAMAALYMRLKDSESAAQCARRALFINENFMQAWMIMIHDSMMHNDLEGGIATAGRALQLDPTNNEVRSLLNTLLMEKRKQKPD